MMILHNNKYQIIINKTNYFGFETEKQVPVMIREIKYTGEVKNDYLSFDYTGLLPSISKIMALSNTQLEKNPLTGDAISSSVPSKDMNTYKHFVSFMAEDQMYLIPLDNDNFNKSVITEELLNHILHGRQRAVLNYDYDALEAEGEKLD
jgi:hypothetical protein